MLRFFEPEVDTRWPAATPPPAAVGRRLTSAPEMVDMMIGEWFPATVGDGSQSSTQRSSYASDSIYASSGFICWEGQHVDCIKSSPDPFLLPSQGGERRSTMAIDQYARRNQNDFNPMKISSILGESENIEIAERCAKRKKTSLQNEDELHCLLPSFESPSSAKMMATARKTQNLGVNITVLQKLVSPSGKTDTASVLQDATVYIKAMHEQIKLLCKTHMESVSHSAVQDINNGCDQRSESLRGMGLCLVPISPLIISIVNHEPSDHYM